MNVGKNDLPLFGRNGTYDGFITIKDLDLLKRGILAVVYYDVNRRGPCPEQTLALIALEEKKTSMTVLNNKVKALLNQIDKVLEMLRKGEEPLEKVLKGEAEVEDFLISMLEGLQTRLIVVLDKLGIKDQSSVTTDDSSKIWEKLAFMLEEMPYLLVSEGNEDILKHIASLLVSVKARAEIIPS